MASCCLRARFSRARSRCRLKAEKNAEMQAIKPLITSPTILGASREIQCFLQIRTFGDGQALSILHQKFGRTRVRVAELRRPNYWTCTPKKYAITAFAICLASVCILASLCNLPCSLRNAIIPAVMTAHSLRTCLSCADIDTNCGV
jgi:hypothetical protein